MKKTRKHGDPEPVEHDYQIRVNKFGRIGNLAFLCSIFVVVAALLWRSAYDIPAGGSAGVGTPLTPVDLIYDTGTAVEPALLDPVLKDFIGTFGREKLRPKRVKISSGTVYSESSLVSQWRIYTMPGETEALCWEATVPREARRAHQDDDHGLGNE